MASIQPEESPIIGSDCFLANKSQQIATNQFPHKNAKISNYFATRKLQNFQGFQTIPQQCWPTWPPSSGAGSPTYWTISTGQYAGREGDI